MKSIIIAPDIASDCTPQELAFHAVLKERNRQDVKWGVQSHAPERWMAIVGEEYGESCQQALRLAFDPNINSKDLDRYEEELTRLTSTAMAALECLLANRERYLREGAPNRSGVADDRF